MAKDVDAEQQANREPAEPTLFEWLWQTAQSVRTTIYVLPAIAAAATIGALVPQKKPAAYYLMLYGPRRGPIVTHLGLDHLYGSTWFLVLMALLLVNLAACVAKSWRRASLEYRGPSADTLGRKLRGARTASCWFGQSAAPSLEERLLGALKRAWAGVHVEAGPDGNRRLVVRRFSLAAYGRILTHLAIFLVALGAVLGVLPWTSLDQEITVSEGETWHDPTGKLGFDVRLDHFRMEYYATTGAPSLYASDVTLLANGAEVKQGTATVNRSLTERGVALGQASWGLSKARLTVTDQGGKQEQVTFPLTQTGDPEGNSMWVPEEQGRVAFLSDRKLALVAEDFAPEAVEHNGKLVAQMSEYPRHPGISLLAVSGLEVNQHAFHPLGWVKQGGTLTYDGYTIRFDGLVYNSTLSARRDMGLPLVWAGFLLTTLGMIVMFYVRPRTFLIELTPAGKGEATTVAVAPSGRELIESDRHLIEKAAQVELTQGSVSQ